MGNYIDFAGLELTKRESPSMNKRYEDVCLVLDGEDYDCTILPEGQNKGRVIKWEMPKRMVKTVKVDFRDNKEEAGIADLKIFWFKSTADQFWYDVGHTYISSLPVIASMEEKQIWLKITNKEAQKNYDELFKVEQKIEEAMALYSEKKEEPYKTKDGDFTVPDGMWLDVLTKFSSEKEIVRHREVMTTRTRRNTCK